jgi:hypothetical protein
LDFVVGETSGHDAGSGLHFELMNAGADGGGVPLFEAAELHGGLGEREAFDAAHGVVGGEKQVQLALEGNAEGIFDERILPGIDVGFFRDHVGVGAFGQSRGAGNGYGLGRAGLHAFAGKHVARSEAPATIGESADAETEGFVFGQRADFAIFGAEVAQAKVDDARVGERCAARFRGVERERGPFLHVCDRGRDDLGGHNFF